LIDSTDEASERRDPHSEREPRDGGGRFGGEFRDSEESTKRQQQVPEKEFRFESSEKVRSTSGSKSAKKIDLGAAAFYKAPMEAAVPVNYNNCMFERHKN